MQSAGRKYLIVSEFYIACQCCHAARLLADAQRALSSPTSDLAGEAGFPTLTRVIMKCITRIIPFFAFHLIGCYIEMPDCRR